MVTSVPLPADVRAPTCLLPLRAIIFDGRVYTVVIPVSSTLYILSGGKLWSSTTAVKMSKNPFTGCLLKPWALAAEVASGWRSESSGWRDMNHCNQSFPATSFVNGWDWTSGPSMYGINYQLIVCMLVVLICSRTKLISI